MLLIHRAPLHGEKGADAGVAAFGRKPAFQQKRMQQSADLPLRLSDRQSHGEPGRRGGDGRFSRHRFEGVRAQAVGTRPTRGRCRRQFSLLRLSCCFFASANSLFDVRGMSTACPQKPSPSTSLKSEG